MFGQPSPWCVPDTILRDNAGSSLFPWAYVVRKDREIHGVSGPFPGLGVLTDQGLQEEEAFCP